MDIKVRDAIIQVLNALPHRMGVLCTISEDQKPHGATVYFDFDENLNIYFATRASTKKSINILKNPNVSFLISNDNPPKTVQIEGTASLVSEPAEQEKYFARILDVANKSYYAPPMSQMMTSDLELMKITPSYAQLSDFDVLREGATFQETKF